MSAARASRAQRRKRGCCGLAPRCGPMVFNPALIDAKIGGDDRVRLSRQNPGKHVALALCQVREPCLRRLAIFGQRWRIVGCPQRLPATTAGCWQPDRRRLPASQSYPTPSIPVCSAAQAQPCAPAAGRSADKAMAKQAQIRSGTKAHIRWLSAGHEEFIPRFPGNSYPAPQKRLVRSRPCS